MKRICVFCGANPGKRESYAAAARELASVLVGEGITVVYGGGRAGIMGPLADEVLRLGGNVIGVIPRALWAREVGHKGLTELRLVDTMHERKTLMADLADAFIALPGGIGTLEEIFEVWTWAQLGMHAKPCGFLDVDGYYQSLFAFLDRATEEGFLHPRNRAIAMVERDPRALLQRFREYDPPDVQQWIYREET